MPQMTLGEFVKQIAAEMQKNGVAMPFRNERPWHELFYELRKEELRGKPEFFQRLAFDWDGPYPKCRDLSEFLHALHWNASVSANNPHYDTINLSEEVAELWAQRSSRLDNEARSFLGRAFARAKEEFSKCDLERKPLNVGNGPRR